MEDTVKRTRNTKQRILETALKMFAEKGYEGTNLRDLAAKLHLSKSALYRHFTGKEQLLESLIAWGEAYYRERFGSALSISALPADTCELRAMTLAHIEFTMRDETVVNFRKLIGSERYRNPAFASLAETYLLNNTRDLFTAVFSHLQRCGVFRKEEDPVMLALYYTQPVSALIALNDADPENITESMEKITRFVDSFIHTFSAAASAK